MKRNYIKPEMGIRHINAYEMFAVSVSADPTKTTDTAYGKETNLWELDAEY